MEHPGGVGGGEPGADVTAEARHLGDAQPPATLEHRAEHLAVDELHREELGACVLADVEGAGDVAMGHLPGELHFATEAIEDSRCRQRSAS